MEAQSSNVAHECCFAPERGFLLFGIILHEQHAVDPGHRLAPESYARAAVTAGLKSILCRQHHYYSVP